jgi:hypothetical protein
VIEGVHDVKGRIRFELRTDFLHDMIRGIGRRELLMACEPGLQRGEAAERQRERTRGSPSAQDQPCRGDGAGA